MIKRERLVIILFIISLLAMKICKNINKNEIIVVESAPIIEVKSENLVQKEPENSEKQAENEEKTVKIEQEEPKKVEKITNFYRLTSYYPEESSNCTGSGKCTNNFTTNDKGWYLYDDKLVLAAATTYLQKSYGIIEGRHYYKYYDEVDVTIDGTTYKGVILDSCGACMSVTYEERLDLFVNSKNSVIDRGYKGNNPISVAW